MNEQQERLNKALEKYGENDSKPKRRKAQVEYKPTSEPPTERKLTKYNSVEEEILFTVRDIKGKVTFLFVVTLIGFALTILTLFR